MSEGDVIIEDNGVSVQGQRLWCQTWDLWLDSSDRRLPTAHGGCRRALVHDVNDRLTINYGPDYPNGVQVLGQLVVDSLFVRGQSGFGSGIATPRIDVTEPAEPPLRTDGTVPGGGGQVTLDLVDWTQRLQTDVDRLQHDVAVFSPDSSQVVIAIDSESPTLFDAKTGAVHHHLTGHQGLVTSAAFSPKGAHVVTTSEDCTARIWDAKTGGQIAALGPVAAPMMRAAFSPDGTRVVTVSKGAVALWDAATGKEVVLAP